jgi:hypothetical protein
MARIKILTAMIMMIPFHGALDRAVWYIVTAVSEGCFASVFDVEE